MTLPSTYDEGQTGHLDDHVEIAAELAALGTAATADTGDFEAAGAAAAAAAAVVSDTAYDATTWNGDTTHAPSKNAVRDKIESLATGAVSDTAYGVGWDGDTTHAPSKNAVYDKIEALSLGSGSVAAKDEGSTVVATATAFDFVGANVTVTDAGSGVATVTITDATLTQEQVEDFVGALLQDTGVIDVTYNDAAPSITATVSAGSITNAMLAKPPSDTAYDATSWDGVTDVAPSKNAVRDQIETMLTSIAAKLSSSAISDTAYAAGWDGDTTHAPSKNAVYDKFELLISSVATLASPIFTGNPTAPTPTAGDNDTSIATTAFVTTAVAAVGAGFDLAQTMAFGG